ncbi:hypothetical protein BGZ76_009717 [Entomortierella beljakovae]|nr:hypothetical protein BGZ76_009717 [Entomortierella beljakovae]
MPITPPQITEADGVIRASFVPWRYYANVVTFGYSFAFWDWHRWERELDWMFLNGVNMALAMVGQEYVFRELYESLGVTRLELNDFFAGPAFTPWQRMGNIQGSWSPLNDSQYKHDWIDSQWELQLKIMGRMQDLNITAILPSFNGFVPNQLTKKFPNVKFQKASQWRLPDPYTRVTYVPSTEPFFNHVTQKFIRLQNALYKKHGINFLDTKKHHYLLDLFNELLPACMTVDCLKQITRDVMIALKDADSKAVWTMQAWFILRGPWYDDRIRAYFDGIRRVNGGEDAFVIDLQSEVNPIWRRTQGYFGIDWGWSMLNNFGARQMLYGSLSMLRTEPFKAYRDYSRNLRGIGITMEGIGNNEYLYQVVLDLPWESIEANKFPAISSASRTRHRRQEHELNQQPLDSREHLESFLRRRYGVGLASDALIEAWTILSKTVWDVQRHQMSQTRSVLDFTPALDMDRIGLMSTIFWYRQSSVVEAWGKIVQSTNTKALQSSRIKDMACIIEEEGPIHKGETWMEKISNVVWRQVTCPVSDGQQFGFGDTEKGSMSLNRKVKATPSLGMMSSPLNVSSFRYDLVDVTREIMVAVLIPGIHKELVRAYHAKELKRVKSWGKLILEAILDTDRMLNSHSHFMLGPWIRDARLSAKTANSTKSAHSEFMGSYADYMEHQSRIQITWWAPVGQGVLANYASKEWGGLVKDFYYPRWKIFVEHLVSAVQNDVELDTRVYLAESLRMETHWLKEKTCLGIGCSGIADKSRKEYPTDAVEDASAVAQDIWDRWHELAKNFAKKADMERGMNDCPILPCRYFSYFTHIIFSNEA